MTEVEKLAAFVTSKTYQDISGQARRELKCRVLDSLGCAIGALASEPIELLRIQLSDFGGNPLSTIIGGGKTAPDRAAFFNGALIRYLDFNDSYLAKGETCHPSDNIAPILAACEYKDGSGRDFLTALAIAYQVQCRLADVAPVRAKGFDHTVQGAFAVAAGVAKALCLDRNQTANAIAISGTSNIALRVTRTGRISNWKGLAYPNTAFSVVHAAFLAMRGITGPWEVFEGNKGLKQSVTGSFTIDWEREPLEAVNRTILKKYNAEIHAQSALEALLELKQINNILPREVERIEVELFEVGYNIIGGGEEGDKLVACTKEEADHSLPYMLAVALLDSEVTPAQYQPERIQQEDVQKLMHRIFIKPNVEFSHRFPDEMPTRIKVVLCNGTTLIREKQDYQGFFTHPLPWESVVSKFEHLAAHFTDRQLRHSIAQAVADLEEIKISELMELLIAIKKQPSERVDNLNKHEVQKLASKMAKS